MLVLTKVHAKPGFLGIPGSTFWQSPTGREELLGKARILAADKEAQQMSHGICVFLRHI